MRLILAIISVFSISCSNNPDLVKEFIRNENLPVEVLKETSLIHTENGEIKVKLEASKIERFTSPTSFLNLSDGVSVYFFSDSNQLVSTLTSEEAVINEKSQVMEANTNVILKDVNNKQLSSQQLIWDERRQLIYTEKEVIITTADEVIHGKGFESTPDFISYKLKQVHGSITISNEK